MIEELGFLIGSVFFRGERGWSRLVKVSQGCLLEIGGKVDWFSRVIRVNPGESDRWELIDGHAGSLTTYSKVSAVRECMLAKSRYSPPFSVPHFPTAHS